MPSPRRWSSIAATFATAAASCGYNPEVLHHLPCDPAEACTGSTGTEGAEPTSSSTAEVTTATSTVDPATTVDPDGSSSASEGTSTSSASSSDGGLEESSTGAPVDNMYAPCDADEQCTSGYCAAGFCTTVCWTQIEGETPCPPPPDDAVGVTITCGRIDPAPEGGGPCEGCFDCGQYCIAVCDGDSICPSGSSCVDDPCGLEDHCT